MARVIQKLQYCILHLFVNIFWSSSIPLIRQPRLSLVDWNNYNDFEPQGPGTYAFGYEIEDAETENVQFRDEERYPNGTVVGSYGYLKPDGNVIMVRYVADEGGYRATVEDSLRGQPRRIGEPSVTNESITFPSSMMLSALMSKDVYKQQSVHEQRQRPIDSDIQRNRQLVTPTKYSNPQAKTTKNVYGEDIQQSWLSDNSLMYSAEPKKLYLYAVN